MASSCTLLYSPSISHGMTGREEWSGQGEGAQHEDIQVYVLMLCSLLPAPTIPPHWSTIQPANHHHDPHILDLTHAFSPMTHMSTCCHCCPLWPPWSAGILHTSDVAPLTDHHPHRATLSHNHTALTRNYEKLTGHLNPVKILNLQKHLQSANILYN